MNVRWFGVPGARQDDRGAAAILVALCMTGILIAVAMVLDFGLVRYEKQVNKAAADSATAAGTHALDVGDGDERPWQGVCVALSFLQANDPALSAMTGTWKTGAGAAVASPCSPTSPEWNQACVPNTQATWAWYHGTTADGRITVDIESGYTLPDSSFAEDATLGSDYGDGAQGGCDQLAVIVEQRQKPGMGSLATSSDLVTRIRSVGRLVAGPPDAPPALLLLERTKCPALSVASNNNRVVVYGNGTAPGSIHADSNGSDPSTCSSSSPVLFGKFANPGIKAWTSETGDRPGSITTTALSGSPGAVGSNASDGPNNVCAETTVGSCGAATGRKLVGRGLVDKRYLTGVKAAMTAAKPLYTSTTTPAGYQPLPASFGCNNVAGSTPLAGNVFVNCPSGITFKNFSFDNATNIVFNGTVSVSSTNTVSMPNANRVYIKGLPSGNGLDVQGTMNLNTGPIPALPAPDYCSTRTAAPRAQLVVGNGSFNAGAQSTFHLCHTTVLMAAGFDDPARQCMLPTTAIVPGAAPQTNLCGGSLNLGAGGTMDWTAPNLVVGTATQSDWDQLEDLALWTESSPDSTIGGNSGMNISGVFFLPNANFIITGGGNQSNGANAQFAARTLTVKGGATVYMKPSPNDAIGLPQFAFSLVR